MKIRFSHTPLALVLAGAFLPPATAHNLDQKSFGQLKASTKYFAHASSKNLGKEPAAARLNKPMPQFSVQDVYGKSYSHASFRGKMVLLVLADTQCPCVQAVEARVADLGKKYGNQGLTPMYVFSEPRDRALQIARFMQNHRIAFPALMDQKQQMLRMLDGQCSSEVYLFDKSTKLRYHGRVDDSTFDPKAVKSADLEKAIVSLTKNQQVARPEVPAMGCAIPRI